MRSIKHKLQSTNKGFTLIELMVATAIFMIVLLVAIGSLVVSSGAAKRARALRTAMDNVNFAMESMTRSLRTATDYSCITSDTFLLPIGADADCSTNAGGSGIAFTPAENYGNCHNDPTDPSAEDATQCRISAYALVPREGADGFVLKKYSSTASDSNGVAMVADNVNIEELKFFVEGSVASEIHQPRVYIIMRGVVNGGGESTEFALQTMVSQRVAK